MRKLNFYLLFSFIFFFSSSCEKNETAESVENLTFRERFIENSDYLTTKQNFKNVDISIKYELWNEKLDHLLALDIPEEILDLIKKIKIEYNRSKYQENSSNIKKIAVQIAQLVPDEDFVKMFFSLQNYDSNIDNLKKQISSSSELISYLQNSKLTYFEQENNSNNKLPDCNCNWSCSAQTINPVVCYATSCNSTNSGCGLFGMSGCDGLVYICDPQYY